MGKQSKKFYRPGTLEEKGTKISIKTQPYINGVVFSTEDPITSFHSLMSSLKVIIEEYENLRAIPGIGEAVPSSIDLRSGITGRLKLLLDFLTQSPMEITLKEQKVDEMVLGDLIAQAIEARHD